MIATRESFFDLRIEYIFIVKKDINDIRMNRTGREGTSSSRASPVD
jgi:hypothetical protein